MNGHNHITRPTSVARPLIIVVSAILTLAAIAVLVVVFNPFQTNRSRPLASSQPSTSLSEASTPAESAVEPLVSNSPSMEETENIVFPPDAGIIDVTQPPYSAKGDGVTDDTDAIQQALDHYPNQQAIIYLPNGTYLLSAGLRWGKGDGKWTLAKRTTLQGQSRNRTILKLKNSCPGFTDPDVPEPVIWTGPQPAERYRNSLRSLTVDTGRNNPGAIGVQFNANYVGCVRNVLIRSGDGQGAIGLDMSFNNEIGPLLVKNLTVEGFDVGIHTKGGYGVTLEHITLNDQNQFGFINNAQSVTIRDLATFGSVPAFWNKNVVGLAVLVDAELIGIEDAEFCSAITNEPGLFVRNVSVDGFAGAIAQVWRGGETNIPGPYIKEWASRLFPTSARANLNVQTAANADDSSTPAFKPSLNLPVKETPEIPWENPAKWANVMAFGANPNGKGDSSEAIQQAIDSGKRTVYLPRGDYVLRNPIVLRGKVRRFIGCEASLIPDQWIPADAVVTVGAGDSPVVILERIGAGFTPGRPHPRFLACASVRTLVLRDCTGLDAEFTGAGEVFLENVEGKFSFHGQKVWARQVCATSDGRNPREAWWHLRNEGGALWALGVRTGGPGPAVITTRGGQTEVLGGLMYSYPTGPATDQPDAAFVLESGALSVSIMEMSHTKCRYSALVSRLGSNGEPSDILMGSEAPGGIGASLIPFFAAD